MSDRYSADVPAMAAAAARLDAASGEVRAAVGLLDEGAGGELGPAGVTAAVAALTDGWSRRLRVVEAAQGALAADLAASRDAYLDAEQAAADALRRTLADDGTTGGLGGTTGGLDGGWPATGGPDGPARSGGGWPDGSAGQGGGWPDGPARSGGGWLDGSAGSGGGWLDGPARSGGFPAWGASGEVRGGG